jgi:deoxyribonuclease-4
MGGGTEQGQGAVVEGPEAVGANGGSETGERADRFGAHVSMAGGLHNAPGRAAELPSGDLQMFTKVPQRWREPDPSDDEVGAFRSEREARGIRTVTVHASYLINNASPDRALWDRSLRSLVAELVRCHRIGADYLVIHPGSATDGDRRAGLERNAQAIVEAVREVQPAVRVLLENTVGRGNILGADPAELAELVDRIRDGCGSAEAASLCLDSCHLFAAGFDVRDDYDGAMTRWADAIDLRDVAVWHLNDSVGALGSAIDRHAGIGDGQIGLDGFRNIVTDPRWAGTPKLIETPKDPDALTADRRNLGALRRLAAGG